MAGTGAGALAASVMTAGPVLCLGLFSFPAAGLARRFGAERTILGALATIAAGTALRGFPALPWLIGGGLLAGAGIAICNVLLPGLVKRDFPDRIAPMTGLYSMSLSGGAALAAALTVPFEQLSGSWTAGLAIWSVFRSRGGARLACRRRGGARASPTPRCGQSRSGRTGSPGR